jgi:hypothetical protein
MLYLLSNFQPAGKDRHPLSADLLFDGLLRIEWNVQIPRQGIRASQWNYAERHTWISAIGDQPLKHFMHSSVAAAGKHNLHPVPHSIARLIGSRPGPRCGDRYSLMSQPTQPRDRMVNLADTPLPPRSRYRIVDERAAHPLILGAANSHRCLLHRSSKMKEICSICNSSAPTWNW